MVRTIPEFTAKTSLVFDCQWFWTDGLLIQLCLRHSEKAHNRTTTAWLLPSFHNVEILATVWLGVFRFLPPSMAHSQQYHPKYLNMGCVFFSENKLYFPRNIQRLILYIFIFLDHLVISNKKSKGRKL